ncbi:MAG TPA: helix-turn-helix transcriptional regulator [Pyrinomonadaceae bacterium]|nr:helix-turn-helix transcriptional regulator [Pyrinomonadaceae bacterium]
MPTITDKQVLDLIELAYESSLDPTEEGWKQFYLNYGDLVSCEGGGLSVFDMASSTYREIFHLHDPALLDELNSTYYPLLPFREDLESLSPGEAFIRNRDYPDGEYFQSEIYKAFFERWRIYNFVHQKIHDDNHFSIGIGFSWPRDGADLDVQTGTAMAEIFPHLRRSMGLYLSHLNAGSEKELLAKAIDESEEGVAIVDRDGNVLFRNLAAERLFYEFNGLSMDDLGRIAAANAGDAARLRRALSDILMPGQTHTEPGQSTISIGEHNEETGLELELSLLERKPFYGRQPIKLALVRIRKRGGRILRPRHDLAHSFGLTPAEERLALILAEGYSIKESCDILNVSANTARTHLKRIFSKTDTHRQSSLVQLVLTGHNPEHRSGRK